MPSEVLRSLPFFASLSDKEMDRIQREAISRSFDKGEILFIEGGPCKGLYVVTSGQIRVFKSSPEGREQVMLYANPGDSFNEVPVFDGGTNPASASAMEHSVVYIVPKEVILSLVAECPAARAMLKVFSGRLRHLASLVEDLSFRSVVSRLAKILLDLAVTEESGAPVPRLTQDEMAAMAGTVRDMIGRALKTLEKAGAIKIEGRRIAVIDPDVLREMV
ncbi:MAG: Crp/Fnr family transcriptional regulator [Chloroflexi bacterium]|nr:Crp/Fnr family transcriptional regulator [Chloroflexota bacterium]